MTGEEMVNLMIEEVEREHEAYETLVKAMANEYDGDVSLKDAQLDWLSSTIQRIAGEYEIEAGLLWYQLFHTPLREKHGIPVAHNMTIQFMERVGAPVPPEVHYYPLAADAVDRGLRFESEEELAAAIAEYDAKGGCL
jgi:hypothetical protein